MSNITPEAISFNPPLTREKLHEHIVKTCALISRMIHFTLGRDEKVLGDLIGMPGSSGFGDPSNLPNKDGVEIGYENVADTPLALTLNVLYDFAYLGILDGDEYELNSESLAYWVSEILSSLATSTFTHAWNESEACIESVAALVKICECANARMILEGLCPSDTFMQFVSSDKLTFSDMALLSGMSEASLRTMANPKRNNPLKTHSHERSTFIAPADAKEWLISKGRYIPLRAPVRELRPINLRSKSIEDIGDLMHALDQHYMFIMSTDEAGKAAKALTRFGFSPTSKGLYLERADLAEPSKVEALAKALNIEHELLALKAEHMFTLHMAELANLKFEKAAAAK